MSEKKEVEGGIVTGTEGEIPVLATTEYMLTPEQDAKMRAELGPWWRHRPPVECSLCGKTTTAYCSTLACEDCHKAESLEDCLNDVQVNAIRGAMGLL